MEKDLTKPPNLLDWNKFRCTGLCRSIGNAGCADKIVSHMCPNFSGGGKEDDNIQTKDFSLSPRVVSIMELKKIGVNFLDLSK